MPQSPTQIRIVPYLPTVLETTAPTVIVTTASTPFPDIPSQATQAVVQNWSATPVLYRIDGGVVSAAAANGQIGPNGGQLTVTGRAAISNFQAAVVEGSAELEVLFQY